MRTDASDVAGGDTPGRDAPMNRAPGIDENLVVNGLLFATPGDRCRYLGTLNSEKPRWLDQNKGRYRRLDDVLQESTQLGRPDNVEAAPTAPNCGTSSRDIRKDGGDDDNSSLVGTLPEHRSPAHQLTSLPAPAVNEDVLSGSTQTEVQPRAKAAATETIGPKTETVSTGATDGKRGRSGSRQLGKQKPPARITKSTRKRSHARMRIVLDALRECPLLSYAAQKADIHRKTLEYWKKRSEAGDDGFDLEWQGLEWRFHEHLKSAIDEAFQKLLDNMWQIAMGVTYKTDENGIIIEAIHGKPNVKMMLCYLELMRPETWGKHRKNNVPLTGGVLVIGGVAKKPKSNTAASVKARKWKSYSRKI